MRRVVLAIVMSVVMGSWVYGYHQQFLNLSYAEGLEFKQVVVGINHRFGREPFGDYGVFGTKGGASVGFGLRAGLGMDQVVSITSASSYDQFAVGYNKAFSFELGEKIFRYGADITYNTFNFGTTNEAGTISTGYIGQDKDRYNYTFNVIHNAYDEVFQWGYGFAWKVMDDFHVLAEYISPVEDLAKEGHLSLTLKYMTFGHNFLGFIANQNEAGNQQKLRGAQSQDFYIGFRLERIFDF
ncbi:hypothetical protein DID78_06600 [Candidatus Marinamargulisbacteria bacterium SCGC AG-343-D04]|nr:hypothetical protein DID78_06600 [Candidatus Marinamargulisbacteria bacterium SCGC AG-343-D04]